MKKKLGGEGQEREKIIIIIPFLSNPIRNTKFKKKITKKFKKLKNTIMTSFEDKIGWKRRRMRIKRIVQFRSNHIRNTKFKKKQKKSENSKIPLYLHFKPA